ncbi:MAG: hypothetical protein HXS41_09050 [Theionarchaea archaeon]|nr:hypothetical protein [Theionarchaea archaeon]MBU7000817.1 hypothetical protein [Theionarchaea archaeon]MBU7021193.1 hypothetical protein [Theionarchaea archaeon]MBU7034534.1 hypothetical protein [Theionarchaea archaeon]MBU7040142.1 hypothetical protein [Theionarchaea archaeon]
MEKKSVVILALVSAIALFVATAVSASSLTGSPLFNLRMEQQSSKMNFLPTEINGFTYTSESTYSLALEFSQCCAVVPLGPEPTNHQVPCEWTVQTCPLTCLSTCPETCYTCNTCLVETCPYTCSFTCGGSTCGDPPCV